MHAAICRASGRASDLANLDRYAVHIPVFRQPLLLQPCLHSTAVATVSRFCMRGRKLAPELKQSVALATIIRVVRTVVGHVLWGVLGVAPQNPVLTGPDVPDLPSKLRRLPESKFHLSR
jgi:hypothetical protein